MEYDRTFADEVIASAHAQVQAHGPVELNDDARSAIHEWASNNAHWIAKKRSEGWQTAEFSSALANRLKEAHPAPQVHADVQPREGAPPAFHRSAVQASLARCGDPNNPC